MKKLRKQVQATISSSSFFFALVAATPKLRVQSIGIKTNSPQWATLVTPIYNMGADFVMDTIEHK